MTAILNRARCPSATFRPSSDHRPPVRAAQHRAGRIGAQSGHWQQPGMAASPGPRATSSNAGVGTNRPRFRVHHRKCERVPSDLAFAAAGATMRTTRPLASGRAGVYNRSAEDVLNTPARCARDAEAEGAPNDPGDGARRDPRRDRGGRRPRQERRLRGPPLGGRGADHHRRRRRRHRADPGRRVRRPRRRRAGRPDQQEAQAGWLGFPPPEDHDPRPRRRHRRRRDRRHGRPLLGRERGADPDHGAGRQGGRGDDAARRRL
jgi:hypothetical protein